MCPVMLILILFFSLLFPQFAGALYIVLGKVTLWYELPTSLTLGLLWVF